MAVSRNRMVIVLLAVAALAMILVAGCTTTEKKTETNESGITTIKAGELLVGSDTAFPPFENLEGDKITGFDVDLMTAIGKEMKLEVKFVTANFDGLIPSLGSKKFDVVASAMTITEDRKKEIAFSDPYIDSDQSLTVQKASGIKTTADLKGKRVGAQTGTTGELWAADNLKGIMDGVVRSYPTATEAFTALEAGQIDAIINDYPVSAYIVKGKSNLLLAETIKTDEKYGFAFNKTNTKLVEEVNKALKTLKENGEYDKIFENWFGKKS